jgi:geranylgeranyl diphosphate synthase type I
MQSSAHTHPLQFNGSSTRESLQENRTLSHLRKSIEDRLPQLLRSSSYPEADTVTSAPLMRATVEQAVTSDRGGKRLRALLLIAASRLPLSSHALLPFSCVQDLACSIEIFQTGALVHDDIMDASPVRRGRPAAHVALAGAYQAFAFHSHQKSQTQEHQNDADSPDSSDLMTPADAAQGGQGLAIMLGDLLATVSLLCAQNACSTAPDALSSRIMTVLLKMQREVEIGQVLDEANSVTPLQHTSELVDNCITIYTRKTASYTCVAPLMIGFLAAGMESSQAEKYATSIGIPLGIAFQLCDDLSDLLPSQPPTGKPLGGDIRDGKRTILLADALSSLSPSDREELAHLYEQASRNPQDVHRAQALLLSSTAVQHSFARIDDLVGRVNTAVSHLREQLSPTDQSNASIHLLIRVISLFSDVTKFNSRHVQQFDRQ